MEEKHFQSRQHQHQQRSSISGAATYPLTHKVGQLHDSRQEQQASNDSSTNVQRDKKYAQLYATFKKNLGIAGGDFDQMNNEFDSAFNKLVT